MGNDLKESKINLPLLHTLKASIFENQQILKILNKKKY